MDTLGPNTQAPPSVLHQRCIYCAGEDRRELLQALERAGPPHAHEALNTQPASEQRTGTGSAPISHWHYRSYEFWRFQDFCLILSGIGTGCLEPLLFEVLRANIVRKIVLVGTAGSMPGSQVAQGEAYLVDRAWPAGTGIDAEASELPLVPRWDLPATASKASSASSDFYYRFAPAIVQGTYPIHHGALKKLYEEHVRRGTELVEMEVAQFYFFCQNFGAADLQYLAVKAIANVVGREDEQSVNSQAALIRTLATAFKLLGIPTPAKS